MWRKRNELWRTCASRVLLCWGPTDERTCSSIRPWKLARRKGPGRWGRTRSASWLPLTGAWLWAKRWWWCVNLFNKNNKQENKGKNKSKCLCQLYELCRSSFPINRSTSPFRWMPLPPPRRCYLIYRALFYTVQWLNKKIKKKNARRQGLNKYTESSEQYLAATTIHWLLLSSFFSIFFPRFFSFFTCDTRHSFDL